MPQLTNLGGSAFSRIESGLTKDKLVNSSRCILYAAPYKISANGTISNTEKEFSKIGVVQGYSFSEQRQIDMIFELGSELPYIIPGRTTGQISLSRVMLFGSDLINVLYKNSTSVFTSIKDITTPLELMFAGYDASGAPAFSRVFSECWIQSRSESIMAGQVVIAENVNIMYANIASYNVSLPAQTVAP